MFRGIRIRTILLIALIPIAALVVGMGAGLISLTAEQTTIPTTPSTGRMTHEQLLDAAAGPDAADQYDYYFSPEELTAIAQRIKPWNCVSGKELSEADQYHCGVDAIFVPDTLNFIPEGYMYEGALMDASTKTLVGIRIVRTAKPDPDVLDA